MIPSSLQDIFGTLSVGIFAAVVALLIWWIYEHPPRKFRAWVRARFFKPAPDASVLAVLVLLLYGFGIIVENLTDHLTDTEKKYVTEGFNSGRIRDFIPALQTRFLESEGQHRFATLFRKCEVESLTHCRLGGLGHDYFEERRSYLVSLAVGNPRFRLFVKNPVNYLKGEVPEAPNSFKKRKKVAVDFVNKLYYASKNWAYSQNTLYEELQSIQRHIEYTRSSFLIATWGIIFLWVSFLAGWELHRRHAGKSSYSWRMQFQRTLGGMLILVFIATVARMGYAHSENNFNERALGYHASYLQRERIGEEASPPYGLLASQWMQTSAEYTALSLQTYSLARDVVEDALKATPLGDERCRAGVVNQVGQKPCPAVILDLDETVIDNGAFQGYLLREGVPYSPSLWNEWVRNGIIQAELVPGAGEFIGKVEDLGVTVIYLSNRSDTAPERAATIETLANLGLDTQGLDDRETLRLLLRTEKASSKKARRRLVEEKYTVLALIGDSLGDFAGVFDPGKDTTIDGRRESAMEARDKWGREWLVLPNPTYGAWQGLLDRKKPFDDLKIWER